MQQASCNRSLLAYLRTCDENDQITKPTSDNSGWGLVEGRGVDNEEDRVRFVQRH